jgi:class 3 adenylate cyclase
MRHGQLHTFLFADLVGFTALAELNGDDAAAEVAIRFTEDAARFAREHGARVVKRLGDAVMIHSGSAAESLLLGTRLQDERGAGVPPVHAGAHTGRAVERGGDWFGATVNLAARVADVARAGELLVTEATVAAAGDMGGIELDCLGPQAFKNVGAPTAVYSVRQLAPVPLRDEPPAARSLVAVPALSPSA